MRPSPCDPDILLYQADSATGLTRIVPDETPPYWAHRWGGGAVLVEYIRQTPQAVAGRRVLDLGCGSGLVAIAAARAGAARVQAVDVDPFAVAATRLNAAANHVLVDARLADAFSEPPPDVDLILAGDVFYDAALALRALTWLHRCKAVGVDILVGDPNRATLPRQALDPVFSASVLDFGSTRPVEAGVYRLKDGA